VRAERRTLAPGYIEQGGVIPSADPVIYGGGGYARAHVSPPSIVVTNNTSQATYTSATQALAANTAN
jgi:hypothetical protein